MNQQERDELRENHRRDGVLGCWTCQDYSWNDEYPCDVIRVLDVLGRPSSGCAAACRGSWVAIRHVQEAPWAEEEPVVHTPPPAPLRQALQREPGRNLAREEAPWTRGRAALTPPSRGGFLGRHLTREGPQVEEEEIKGPHAALAPPCGGRPCSASSATIPHVLSSPFTSPRNATRPRPKAASATGQRG